jgi:hypothetical protein
MQVSHKVKYTSDYLVQEVKMSQGPGIHRITLTWDPGHPQAVGDLILDPNACTLDEFGDSTACTKIASRGGDVKLTPFKHKPGHQAYTLESRPQDDTGNFTALPLRLVTVAARGKHPALVHLLVLRPDKTIERIIELHPEHRA